ncbi:MAG: rhomboid family intramembrane serine protease [Bacteroidetes bacterium]|nr:MAG: rhomboid family intramembrane serine protease [Bacteroidota bacterium]
MFPIHDTIPSRRVPLVNYLLILLNALVFLYELGLGSNEVLYFFHRFGLVPLRFSDPAAAQSLGWLDYYPFLTNMFLHGGWAHFVGNMWTLWIFGDNVEDRMGRGGYLLFYLLCGLIASWAHYMLNLDSDVPALGASGAISGVMGAYMFLFPRSRIVFLVPIFFFPYFFEISAFFYIGVWFLGQLYSGTAFLMTGSSAASIAFWAHIGGFVAGVLLFRFFDKGPDEEELPYEEHYG